MTETLGRENIWSLDRSSRAWAAICSLAGAGLGIELSHPVHPAGSRRAARPMLATADGPPCAALLFPRP